MQLQVWHLASLPNLSQLLFSDPDWGASPIAKLCNYATYAAVNLPNLQVLDSQPLSPQSKAVAEATYLKKKMYYNMRINTLRRKGADLAQQAQQGLQVDVRHLQKHLITGTPSISNQAGLLCLLSPNNLHATALDSKATVTCHASAAVLCLLSQNHMHAIAMLAIPVKIP